MDDEALIEQVRNFSHLYDPRNVNFKNKIAKENAWKTISEVLFETPQVCENRWSLLRNRYAGERKKVQNVPSGSPAAPYWKHFTEMNFLDRFVRTRKTYGNVKRVTEPSHERPKEDWNTPVIVAPETLPVEDEDIQHSDENTTPIVEGPKITEDVKVQEPPSEHKEPHQVNLAKLRGRPKSRPSPHQQFNIEKAFNSLTNVLTNENEDEDDLFGKTIASTLKKITNRKKKAQAKLEMWQVVLKYEDDE